MTEPFLKWVGSKRKVIPQLRPLLPANIAELRYVEPFLGSGALFFALRPARAVLADISEHLITTYVALRDDLDAVIRELRDLANDRAYGPDPDHYYQVRNVFNSSTECSPALRAAMFIYLNKTCFNGVYRVNRKGGFNVPVGSYENPEILDGARLRECSAALQGVELHARRFEDSLADVGPGDFVYLDPPYVPVSKSANFTSYAKFGFSPDDQRRVAKLALEAAERGALVMASNSDTPFARELYAGLNLQTVSVARSVNSNGMGRGTVPELVARNYDASKERMFMPSEWPKEPIVKVEWDESNARTITGAATPSYEDFLASKRVTVAPAGFEPGPLHSGMFDYQDYSTRFALRLGRTALFLDTGLGKSFCEVEWSRCVAEHTGGRVLILAPLGVAHQTVREAARWGVTVVYALDQESSGTAPIVITNYERFDRFDMTQFVGVVLDESGILKSYMGKTKRALVERCACVPYRLCASATPAPNDHMELGNHVEFLGIMKSNEMLTRWFVNDTSAMGTYRLKGHAVESFWDWVASWSVCIKSPEDLGYDGSRHVLPELVVKDHVVDADLTVDTGGRLFRDPSMNATSLHREKRLTLEARAKVVAGLVAAEPDESWMLWCDTDEEADALVECIPGLVEVRGSHSADFKESAALWFTGQGFEECRCGQGKKRPPTTASTTSGTKQPGTRARANSETPTTPSGAHSMPPMLGSESGSSARSKRGKSRTLRNGSTTASSNTESTPTSIEQSSSAKEDAAQSAEGPQIQTSTSATASHGYTSTTATERAESEGFSARLATSASESSVTTPSDSSELPCTCGMLTAKRPRLMLSKSRIYGFGMNFQHCARTALVSVNYSYEAFYQVVRRFWRFGQTRPVHAHVVMASTERAIWSTVMRKSAAHDEMRAQMSAAMQRQHGKASPLIKYSPTVPIKLPSWLKSEVA